MGFTPSEPCIVPLPLRGSRRPALTRGLLLVMKAAEGSKVGLCMVITRTNVIHIGRVFSAPLPVDGVSVRASESIAPQDALSEDAPVSRETTSPI